MFSTRQQQLAALQLVCFWSGRNRLIRFLPSNNDKRACLIGKRKEGKKNKIESFLLGNSSYQSLRLVSGDAFSIIQSVEWLGGGGGWLWGVPGPASLRSWLLHQFALLYGGSERVGVIFWVSILQNFWAESLAYLSPHPPLHTRRASYQRA